MPEALLTTRTVRATPDRRAVERVATLDAGAVVAGMFVHIPMNVLMNFTDPIASAEHAPDGCVRLLLDCGPGPNGADLVMLVNIEGETLRVLETGER